MTEEPELSRGMLKGVSLFSGAGGLDVGLEQAGFETKVCVEFDPRMCETLRRNRPRWAILEQDIRQTTTSEILEAAGLRRSEVDIVAGGPPCQAFSKSAYWVPGRLDSILNDPRALLLREFVRVVHEARPRVFLMENVFGLAYSHGRPALDAALNVLTASGYTIQWKVLNAADYGVPQKRQRVVVVGSLEAKPFQFPAATHAEMPGPSRDLSPYVSAGHALEGVRAPPEEGEVVGGKYGELLPKIPPGSNYLHFTEKLGHPKPLFEWRSKYWSFLLKLSPQEPSWTIQASPGPYVGPFHWDNRRLRIPEVKRLQTFPDEWKLAGSRGDQWKQLGNAVPSLLARTIGTAIRDQFFAQAVSASPHIGPARSAARAKLR